MNPIVGIGELLWDIYPDGRMVAGGAPFNFAFHCHQLGHPAVIVSRVGDDDLGRELREEVKRLGLSDEYIQTDHEHPTGTVRVTLDENKVPTYTISENVAWDYIGTEGPPVDEEFAHDIAAICFGTLALRHPVSRSTIREFVRPGPAMPTALRIFDVNLRVPRTHASSLLIEELIRDADWIKVNEAELIELLSGYYIDDELPRKESTIRWLIGHSDERKVGIVTRGSKSTAVADWQRTEWIPAVPARVVDTVGAGDAFTAAMVCLHLEGRPLRECARFANHYAARVCEHQGATPHIDRAEVERAAFGVS